MLNGLFELIIDRNRSISVDGVNLNFTAIQDIVIDEEINKHTSLSLKGELVNGGELSVGQKIQIVAVSNTNEILSSLRRDLLFTGLIEKVESSGSFLTLEAKSFSILLDREKRKRSFQDVKKTYQDILDVIEKEGQYEKFNFVLSEKSNKTIDNLLIQYNETDWEFLRRISSHFNEGIVIENGATLSDDTGENQEKKWNLWLGFVAEGAKSFGNTNFVIKGKEKLKGEYLVVSSREKYELGNLISFQGKVYIICKSKISYEKNIIVYEYVMYFKESFYIPKEYNQNIAGEKVLAEVVEVGTGENLTRVRVDFIFEDTIVKKDEEEQKSVVEGEVEGNTRASWDKFWFKFATPYSSKNGGIYIMPEEKDRLLINFINSNEDSAYAGESLREENELQEKHPEVVHKRIKISTGQQVMLSKELEKVMLIGNDDRTVFADIVKDHIRFVADESEAILKKDLITLKNSENTVQMNTDGIMLQRGNGTVNMTDDGINFKMGDATISMKSSGIELKCGGSKITIGNGKVNVKG